MTVQLKNQTELLNGSTLLRKVKMVTSNRDGRIGFIVKATESIVTIKLEGIEKLYEFSLNQLIDGFSFNFTKEELVESTYKIKSIRKLCPRLMSANDVYLASNFIYDYLSNYFDDVSNHEVFLILENLKKKFESNKK